MLIPIRKKLLWSALLAAGAGLAYRRSRRWRGNLIARLAAESRIAETSKGPIEYAVLGKGSPVLVLHGTPGGYDQGLAIARLWISNGSGASGPSETGLEFISVSRPGYLRTPLESGRTPDDQADASAALLDALGLRKVAVLAASGGGPSAVRFALRHPDRLSRLVLLEAVTGTMHIPEANPVRTLMEFDLAAWSAVRLAAAWQKIWRTAWMERHPGILVKALEMNLPLDLRGKGIDNDIAQMNALAPLPLSGIRVPTLIIHGEKDGVVPHAFSERAAREIPGAEFLSLPGEGHFSTPLDPRAIAAILRFLAEEEAGTP